MDVHYYAVKPFETVGWGARIWLTDDGCLSIYSDWGSYGYWWGSPGCEIREFLCRINDDYLLSKLCSGRPDVIDETESRRAIRKHILEYRREGQYDRDFAKREWELVYASSFTSEVEAHQWYLATEIQDAYELIQYERPPQAVAFVKHCWLPFRMAMRHEMGEPLREAARRWFGSNAK